MKVLLMDLAIKRNDLKAIHDDKVDYRALLMDACEQLAATTQFKLVVCDDVEWPVDVCTDLAVFLEELPDNINQLKLDKKAILSLYEQGIETNIIFTPNNKNCYIHCENILEYKITQLGAKFCEIEDLKKVILELEAFLKSFLETAPFLLEYDEINAWLKGNI